MRRYALLAFLLPTLVLATPAFEWPATPEGRIARDFFAMLADGSEGAIRKFEGQYRTAEALARRPMADRVRQAQKLRELFGATTPLRAEPTGTGSLKVTVADLDEVEHEVEFFTVPGDPAHLDKISIAGPPAPEPGTTGIALTEAIRAALVENVAKTVAARYVYPELGERMAKVIRDAQRSGAYKDISRERGMAARLTKDLRSVANDRHLAVMFEPASGPRRAHPMNLAQENYAFEKAEILDGNVGYLRLNGFSGEAGARDAADAAFAFLANADAVVIDLRGNGGGEPELIRYMLGYFFEKPTVVNTMVGRDGKVLRKYETGKVKGKRFRKDLPLYVLTSARTFSGGEEFAYDVQALKRGTLVGETTGGGAHPVETERMNERFVLNIPYERAQNPVTGRNWEGTGVVPDVAVPAAQALDKALEIIRVAAK